MSKVFDAAPVRDPVRAQDVNQSFIRVMEWVRELARGQAAIAADPVKGATLYFDGSKWVARLPGTVGQVWTMGADGLPGWA